MRLPSLARWAGGVLVLGLLVACGQSEDETRRLNAKAAQMLQEQKEARMTPEQKDAEAKAALEKQMAELKKKALASRMVLTVRAVRDSLNSPKSFELVRAMHVEKTDTICLVYRGTNGFNAVMTESMAIDAKGQKVDWNRFCAGQQAVDWADKIALAIR